jgi:hypothetical protein
MIVYVDGATREQSPGIQRLKLRNSVEGSRPRGIIRTHLGFSQHVGACLLTDIGLVPQFTHRVP